MTAWAKIGLIIAVVTIVFMAGWQTKGKFDEAAQAQILKAEITARIAAEKKASDISAGYEAHKIQSQQTIAQLLTQRRQSHAKHPSPADCRLSDDSLHAINSAAADTDTR